MLLNILILALLGISIRLAPLAIQCGFMLLIGWMVKLETFYVAKLEKSVSKFQNDTAQFGNSEEEKHLITEGYEDFLKKKSRYMLFSNVITGMITFRKIIFPKGHAAFRDNQSAGPKDRLQMIVNFWEFFQFILPPKTRREAFEPAYNEIKKDYLLTQKYASKWVKRWLCVCFLCQTSYMIADCFKVFFGSKAKSLLFVLVPVALREVVRRYLGN